MRNKPMNASQIPLKDEVPPERAGKRERGHANDDAREWTRESDPELGCGVPGITLHLSDSSEREERTRRHRLTSRAGDHRMRQFVKNDASKERQSRQSVSRPHQCARPRRVQRVQVPGERHREQRGNDEPAEMKAVLDSESATDVPDLAASFPRERQGCNGDSFFRRDRSVSDGSINCTNGAWRSRTTGRQFSGGDNASGSQ
jgi:hypothetical protein